MEKLSLLLHSCCGPCSTSVIERLADQYNLTVFYYNPNIYPQEEYLKRLAEQKRFVATVYPNIKVIDGQYTDAEKFLQAFTGLENCKEGGSRCEKCITLRLTKTAKFAKENNYDMFASTLSVSPHKNAQLINNIGLSLQEEYNVKYLVSDFKKQDGYLRSIQLSKQYNLYRQKYCGCKYSIY